MQKHPKIFQRKSNGTIDPVSPHPDPILAAERLSDTAVLRFFRKVRKTDTCWFWTGAERNDGPFLGRGGNGQGGISARRMAWLVYFGEVPGGVMVRTDCGNSGCVNPGHLVLGTGDKPNMNSLCFERAAALESQAGTVRLEYTEQDPALPEGFSKTFLARLKKKIRVSDNGCWIWTGATNSDGYGTIGKGWDQPGNIVKTHVAAWLALRGPIPEGMLICHNCPGGDNPSCCNPNHMFLGTHSDNTLDAAKKCKAGGNPFWNSILTADQIIAIKTEFSKGNVTKAALGRRYGVSATCISGIVFGKRHAHIGPGICGPAKCQPADYEI